MRPRGRIKIEREFCKGCGYCVEACPSGAIAIGTRFNKQGYFPAISRHPARCTGCAMCATVCPEIAINVYRNNGAQPPTGKKRSRRTTRCGQCTP